MGEDDLRKLAERVARLERMLERLARAEAVLRGAALPAQASAAPPGRDRHGLRAVALKPRD